MLVTDEEAILVEIVKITLFHKNVSYRFILHYSFQ